MEKCCDGNCCIILPILVALVAAVTIRISYLLFRTKKPLRAPPSDFIRTLIILGSGGHTAEMLGIVNILRKDRFVPRFYVAAVTDGMSLQKARALEESLDRQESGTRKMTEAQFMQIYRSREVGQSYLTSIGTTLAAMVHALWLTFKIRPQVIICNGPGTCIPLCIAAFLFKVAGLGCSSIFYVESIARVRKLSLSGLLLYKLRVADQFFVQWPQLQGKYPRSHYVGCLM